MADERARLRRLDLNLRNSFSKIKGEMDDIKGKVEFQLAALKDMKKEFETSKNDFVTTDKINVLKIKVGDLREELKAVERLETRLREIEKKAADKEQTKIKIDELKDHIDSVEKTSKDAATGAKVEKLVREINDEFGRLRKSVKTIEEKGGSIVRDKLGKLEFDINKKTVSLGNKINLIADEIKKYPAKQEINSLLRDINREFDEVKDSFEELRILRNDLKTVRREKLGKAYFEQQLEKLNSEMQELRTGIKELRKTGSRKEPVNKNKKRKFNFYLFANIMIVLAFVLLGASLVLFFTDREGLMDYFIYGAIASFLIGVLTRIVVVMRE